MRVFSFGGGVQSTAALVLAAQGGLACDAFLFANVGDDSEHPATLRYVHEVAMPYAEQHGLRLVELRHARRDGTPETIYSRVMSGKRGLVIPVHLQGSSPMRRQCTQDFKIKVVNRWLYRHGARKDRPALVMLGISADEWQRARRGEDKPLYVRRSYPLLDRELTRQDCRNIIERAGLPIPPKSACWFCPFHSLAEWVDIRDATPELLGRAAELERHLSEWSTKRGHRPVYLTSRGPLFRVVGSQPQPRLFEENACESGYCFT